MPDPPVPSEVEAKLLVPQGADLRAIAQLERVGTYRLRPRGLVRLHSVYLDTENLTLSRHAVALRLRRQGRAWEATAKWAGKVNGVVHDRPELTVKLDGAPPIPFTLPPGPLHTQLAALVAGRPLQPILVTDIQRRRFDALSLSAGDDQPAIAELALDRVHIRAPDQRTALTYSEVEIEQLHGTRRDVTALARILRQRFHLAPSHDSKFVRGFTLLYGANAAAGAPLPVSVDDTVEVVARKIVALHLERLRAYDPGTRLGEDPEAVHGMRVAVRRLRAALHAFEAGLSAKSQRRLRAELQWLGQLLGAVRDLDVQLGLLQRYSSSALAEHVVGLESFRAHLEGQRARQRDLMLTGLDSDRYHRLLLDLERLANRKSRAARSRAENAPITVAGAAALSRAFRRVFKRGKRIGATPKPEDLHALRIRAKRLRYLLEFLRDVTGKPGRRLIKRLVELQDLLGSHNDAVVAAHLVTVYVEGEGAGAQPATLLALGAFLGAQVRLAADARAAFQKAWRRFARRRTLDDFGTLSRKLAGSEASAEGKIPA